MTATSRRLIHNLNELRRLQVDYFVRLGQGESRTVLACGSELEALALHYRQYVGNWRLGMDPATCGRVAQHFSEVADAMEQLQRCLREQPEGIQHIYQTYQNGHAAWSQDGVKRALDANHLIAQLWRDGHAADWFLPVAAGAEQPGSRREELVHLAGLMRRLAGIYQSLQGLRDDPEAPEAPRFDEKDALVMNLANLIRKKARPALHTVHIATSIHAWATGDLSPSPARFQAAYQSWKNRPRSDPQRHA